MPLMVMICYGPILFIENSFDIITTGRKSIIINKPVSDYFEAQKLKFMIYIVIL